MAKQEQRPWHHLFGLSWMDYLRGSTGKVEPEKDLSEKKQLLDLVIQWPGPAQPSQRLPDGFEELAPHNLITFKSHQEALDADALEELVGHGVNYRKQVSPSFQALLPRDQFRLFAICVRFPHNLMQELPAERVSPGVYDIPYLTRTIRLVVIHELPRVEHNAMLLLFSARDDLVEYAANHYDLHSPETSTLLLRLVQQYRKEGIAMPETLEEFARRTRQELLQEMSPEDRQDFLRRMSPEDRQDLLQRMSAEDRRNLLRQMPPEERLASLSAEDFKELSPERRAELLRWLADKGPANPAN
jgi:hypothetical protein